MTTVTIKTTGRVDPNATHILDLTQDAVNGPHVFIGVIFRDGAGNPVTPSAGTYTFDVQAVNMANYEAVTSGTDIDATAPVSSLSFAQNAQKLRYTPTGITGADTVEFGVSSNKA